MHVTVLAVGLRQPAWADSAWADYSKRLPAEWQFTLKALKAEPRAGRTAAQCLAAESARFDAAMPKGARRIALDEQGTRLSTRQLAERLLAWQADGRDLSLMIGGPDGLAPALKEGADERLRLSDLTLPHALARVLLAEALYRAWSVTAGHPYHRE